jgi:Lhr-like helicase
MATTLIPPTRQLVLGVGDGSDADVDGLHRAVGTWFRRRFPEGPTEPQREAWPHIAAGSDTLVAAPTGSGKTLAGFLVSIDRLYRAHDAGEQIESIARVVYVSPLKALAVDIAENLERPLREIAEVARELGLDPPDIRVAVRTGDTPNAERSRMTRKPPSFFVTTPESLSISALTPITWPLMFSSGPPEFPWLIAASVWIESLIVKLFGADIWRWSALTMSLVTVS